MLRGKVLRSVISGGRVLLDVQLRSGEVRTRIPLLLGPFTWRPKPGTDLGVAQLAGTPDQMLAIADDAAGRILGLTEGEFGLAGPNGEAVTLKLDHSLTVTGVQTLHATGLTDATIAGSGTAVIDFPLMKLGAGATQFVRLANGAASTKVMAE